MPIYEFVCESCGRLEEHLQKVSDPPPAACPECQGKMAKIMSRNSFQLKGGGWYKDLYGSTGKAGTAATPPASSDGGSKSAAPAAPAAAPAAAAASAPAASAPAGGGTKT
jgi:putative FmdB family regulatory protein